MANKSTTNATMKSCYGASQHFLIRWTVAITMSVGLIIARFINQGLLECQNASSTLELLE